MARQDTKLESEGAEFLVLGHLLVERISCYKAYVNFPGYDLTAVNADSGKVARIQVKSRWASDYNKSFPLKNLDADFVVHVALNRGFAYSKKGQTKDAVKSPVFYIFPMKVLKRVRGNDSWNKVPISKIPDLEKYIGNWGLIRAYIA